MKKQQKPTRNLNIFFPFSTRRNTVGWRRWLNIILRKIGLTWRYSPVRRLIQVSCLSLFLYLFFYVAWPHVGLFSGSVLSDREWLPVEFFLWIDPLVGLTTSIASWRWNVALLGLGGIFLVCILFPRGFCGYICPLGTLIDVFDWLIGRHITRFRFKSVGGWMNLKYYLLAAVLIASFFGVLLAGYIAAIPILTRGLLFTAGRLQLGVMKGWNQVGPVQWPFYLSLALFAVVFLFGFFGNRFWCRYVCPTGALFSVFAAFRIGERKVETTCIGCGKCVRYCPFGAIKEDFTTRTLDCTFCQTCGGTCPTHAIKFVTRWIHYNLKEPNDPPVVKRSISRRGFILSTATGVVVATGMRIGLADGFQSKPKLLRPPGSVPKPQFLDLCIRCGECVKVCPGPVLHLVGLEGGWEAIWTPVVVPSQAGCHQDCNFCTQVCPTGAIRPLSIKEKRKTHIGLAVINKKTCLPYTGEQDCQLCFDECEAAGYHAIQMRQINLNIGDIPTGVFSELELEEMSHIEAPFVNPDACVGCGICEYRCYTTYVKGEKISAESAIVVVPENEDRRL